MAALGAGLGVINTIHQLNLSKVKLRIVPKSAVPIAGGAAILHSRIVRCCPCVKEEDQDCDMAHLGMDDSSLKPLKRLKIILVHGMQLRP